MTIDQYISNINAAYKRGNATEHTYRGDLKQLIESIISDVSVTNEPKRQSCGAPDYILTKKDIPVGFIEAKDIGDKDLEGAKKTGNKEQFDRYKASLNNLIFTDYLDFHLYRDGVLISKIAIGEITTPPVGHPSKGGEFRQSLYQRNPTFRKRPRSSLEFLHRRLSTRTKMAERQKRQKTRV